MIASDQIPETMKAVRVHAFDGASGSVRVDEVPVPRPRSGEVLVRMAAAPVNPSDVMFTRGLYGFTKATPCVPGFEGAGTVVASGGGMYSSWLVGKRVACGVQEDADGTWSEYVVTSPTMCIPLPKEISDEQGASLIVNPLTAMALLENAKRGGHKAAIHTAAASALGRMMLRMSERDHYPVIHVVRRDEQAKLLREMGAKHVLDSSDSDFEEQLHERAKKLGATIAFDAVAGELTGKLLAAMPRGSEAVVYGALSLESCGVEPGQLIFERKRLSGFWLSDWIRKQGNLRLLLAMREVQRHIGSELSTSIAERVPLSGAIEAIARYEENMTRGKVLLVPGGEGSQQ